ncbi:sulfatase-like hydrolase/transferase [Escherichia coli]
MDNFPFDKGSFDPKNNGKIVKLSIPTKIGIDKAIEAAQKSTPTLLSLMDEGVRFTNGYVAHGVSGPSRAAIMTGRAPARFGVYSNTDAQDGIPLTETFLPELFQNHGYYTAAVGKMALVKKISNVPVPEDKQTRDYHDNFTTFFCGRMATSKTVALITLWDSTLQERHITTPLHCSKKS